MEKLIAALNAVLAAGVALKDAGIQGHALNDIQNVVNAVLGEMGTAVHEILNGATPNRLTTNEAVAFVHEGKIAAIKLLRARTGVGLKEAKDIVEAYADKHGLVSRFQPF